MFILTRYVSFELAKIFLITLASLTSMMLIFGLVREASQQGLGPAQVVQLLPYVLPDALRYTIPAAGLFAVSLVYGRMSGSNEVVAVKSMGISPLVMIWPTLILAFLISLSAVWLNDLADAWARRGIQRVVIGAIEQIAYSRLRTQRSFTSPRFSINVKRVEGHRLIRPTLTFAATRTQPAVTVVAREAELHGDTEVDELKIVFRDFSIYGAKGMSVREPGEMEIAIPLGQAIKTEDYRHRPANLPLREVAGETERHVAKMSHFERQLTADTALQLLDGDFSALAAQPWTVSLERLKAYREHLYRLWMVPYRRWANGFSCFCFVFVGAPMAIRLRNSSVLQSFFACFMPILLVYYPLLAYAAEACKEGRLPPYAVWLCNLILIAWGVWLLRKVVRY